MNFQLYRGNLHNVPDVPRRWPLAKPTISLQLFKKAICKRQEALLADQRTQCEHANGHQESQALVKQESQTGDEDDDHEHVRKRKREHSETSGMEMEADEDLHKGSERKSRICAEAHDVIAEDMAVDGADGPSPHPDVKVKVEAEEAGTAGVEMKNVAAPEDLNVEKEGERLEAPRTPAAEAPRTPAAKDEDCTKPIQTRGSDACNSHDKGPSIAAKRAEIQEKLKQLQETKHQLVQILKQVLITEEESKRKSQGLIQYSVPYASIGTADLIHEQKMGSDLQSADLEEGELDYTRNPGPPVVASSYGSHFPEFHPQTLGTTPGRHFNNQQSK